MIYLLGDGGFSKEIKSYLKYSGITNFLCLSYDYKNFYLKGDVIHPVIKTNSSFILATGDLNSRKAAINLVSTTYPYIPLSSLFKNFYAEKNSLIVGNVGFGNVFCPGTKILSDEIIVGNFNLFNVNSMISHESVIGNYNIFCPNITSLGRVKIGNDNFIGSSVTILPNLSIGNNNSITAGIVLRESIPSNRKVRINKGLNNVSIFSSM